MIGIWKCLLKEEREKLEFCKERLMMICGVILNDENYISNVVCKVCDYDGLCRDKFIISN